MKLLIIRGDLQSHSGHSAAARDYCRFVDGVFDRIVGVDIHFSPDRPFEPFTHPVVSDDEAKRLAAQAEFALVVTYTTPGHYARYPGAANVGLTVWETDRLPLQGATRSPWVDQINSMDGLWVQSVHSKEVYEASGVTTPVRVVPWPARVTACTEHGLPEGEVYDLDRRPWFGQKLVQFARLKGHRFRWSRWLMERGGPRAVASFLKTLRISSQAIEAPAERALVCVAQDVPRKGLLLFLSEWMEFKRRPEAAPWTLILKTTPIDPRTTPFDFVTRFWLHVDSLKKQLGVGKAGLYLWTGNLNGPDFGRLLSNCHGAAAASLGEGFCGPAAQALALGKPLVTPRHTAFADYVPEDYPYAYASRPVAVSFVNDPLRVYDPASSWQVPVPFAMCEALSRLAKATPHQRALVAEQTRQHVEQQCGPERVREIIEQEVRRLRTVVTRRRAA
jgi:glycosyltransferase involved in cell wall biosynthesis